MSEHDALNRPMSMLGFGTLLKGTSAPPVLPALLALPVSEPVLLLLMKITPIS